MTKTHAFIIALASLVGGIGLVIAGALTGNETLTYFGSGLIGNAIGTSIFKRPQDA